MKSLRSFVFVLAALVFCAALAFGQTAPLKWEPQRTWVFMVGLLKWQDSKTFEAFPQKNRRDLVLLNALRNGGVPPEQVVYLKDQSATTARIKSSFRELLAKTQPGDWIIVYFEGHGYVNEDGDVSLASYNAGVKKDRGWLVKSIPDTIDKYFNGNYAMIALDNCHSGAIVDALKRRRSPISYAAFASTPANSTSTGNWTFTESLINAFRGEPFVDANRDGEVTLGETIKSATDDMMFGEEQIAQFAVTGEFSDQTVLANSDPTNKPRLGERVEAFDGDDWYRAIITDTKNGKFKVHYYGYEYDEDEYLSAKDLRKPVVRQFKVGEAVEANSDGDWYAAHIKQVKGSAHLVTYDDYDESEDEWLPSASIRKRKRRH